MLSNPPHARVRPALPGLASLTLATFSAIITTACGGGDGSGATALSAGPTATSSAVVARATALSVVAAPALACPTGGKTVTTGIDSNGNGVIDASEVTDTFNVCNGAVGAQGSTGMSALVSTVSEPAGANCAAGGTRISFGLDIDGDGLLEAAEVTSVRFSCNGSAGANGTNGTNGATGATGATGAAGAAGSNGTNGTNGINALTTLVAEAAGPNCAAGGNRIATGLDVNGDGILQPSETSLTTYVCNGAAGAAGANGVDGLKSLTSLASEAAGTHCAAGGTRLTSGLDLNGNGVLDAAEVTSTAYSCNGSDGATGPQGARGATGATGANGSDGTNGTNGTNGLDSLLATAIEPSGGNCANGGSRLTVGLDLNGNGTLDVAEITSTSFTCSAAGGGTVWSQIVAATVQMVANMGYLAANDSTRVVATLPASPAIGDTVDITGSGAAGWKVAQNAGQSIRTSAMGTSVVGPARLVSGVWTARPSPYTSNYWFNIAGSTDGSVLYGASSAGLVKSLDYGSTWVNVFSTGVSQLASSANGQMVYAVTQSLPAKLYRSADGGATWSLSATLSGSTSTVATNDDGSRVVTASGVNLYLSLDGGNTVQASAPGGSTISIASVAIDGIGTRIAFGQGSSSGSGNVYTSTDSGNSWTQRVVTGQGAGWFRQIAYAGNGSKLATAIYNNNGYVYVSSDGGATWTAGTTLASWQSLSISADGSRMVGGTTSAGILTSTDGVAWATYGSLTTSGWFGYVTRDGSLEAAVTSFPSANHWYYTPQRSSTTAGSAGSLSGDAWSSLSLLYTGSGVWMPKAFVGTLSAQ